MHFCAQRLPMTATVDPSWTFWIIQKVRQKKSSDYLTTNKRDTSKPRIINWLNKTNTAVVGLISGGLTPPKGMRWTGWQYGVGTATYFLTQLRLRSLSWTSGRRLSTSSHSSMGTVWRGSQTSASWERPSRRTWPGVHKLQGCEKGPKETLLFEGSHEEQHPWETTGVFLPLYGKELPGLLSYSMCGSPAAE